MDTQVVEEQTEEKTEEIRDSNVYFKGKPGPGRPKGLKNRKTLLGLALLSGVTNDPAYCRRFLKAARRRELPPLIEKMAWEMTYGKPKDPDGDKAVTVNILNILQKLPEEQRKQVGQGVSALYSAMLEESEE